MTPRRTLADMMLDVELRGLSPLFAKIAQKYDVLLTEVLGPGRHKGVSDARQECWVLLRERGWSYPRIAELFDRDHTTVMDGVKRCIKREFAAIARGPSVAKVAALELARVARR